MSGSLRAHGPLSPAHRGTEVRHLGALRAGTGPVDRDFLSLVAGSASALSEIL